MSRPPPSRVLFHDVSGRDRHVLPSSEGKRTSDCHVMLSGEGYTWRTASGLWTCVVVGRLRTAGVNEL